MDLSNSRENLEARLILSEPSSSPSSMPENVGHEDETERMANISTLILPTDDNSENDAWYHNPYQVMAMISNFSTSYNVVNISLVLPILQQLEEKSTSQDAAACASSLLAGMVVGQLLGGALGDSFLGRMGALTLVMLLQITASLVSAFLSTEHGDIYLNLAICRFFLGVGAGGVYPLAAVLSAENGETSSAASGEQVQRVVLTFSTQGLGFVTVPLVAVPALHFTSNLDVIWRLLLGLGSVPGLIMMIMQWRVRRQAQARGAVVPNEEPVEDDETAELDSTEGSPVLDPDHGDAVLHESDTGEMTRYMGWWGAIQHEPGLGGKIIGTAGTWCLFDILFYGNTLFQPIVVEAAFGVVNSDSPLQLLRKTATDSLILTSIALPGYFVAGLLMGKRTGCVTQTPRYVMLQGFAAMSVLYLTIGSNWSYLRRYPSVLVTLYGLTFFFANYGPNTTTFILPSLLYSPECRSTWNGISAASGKMGALLGATLFAPAADKWGDANVMIICSGVAIVALIITWFFVPKDGSVPASQGSEPAENASPRSPTFEAA